MNLRDYWLLIRRSWIIIIVCGVLGAAAGAFLTSPGQDRYISSSRIFIGATNSSSETGEPYNIPDLVGAANSLAMMVDSDYINAKVTDELGSQATAVSFSATVPKNTTLLEIKATSATPESAIAGANYAAEYIVDATDELSMDPEGASGAFAAQIVTEAVSADQESSVGHRERNIAGGLFFGLFVGIIVAGIVWLFDKRIRSLSEAEEISGYELLSVIPETKDSVGQAIAYDQLGALVQEKFDSQKYLVVASAGSQEKPNDTAVNLAESLSKNGHPTVVATSDQEDLSLFLQEEKKQSDRVLVEIPGVEIASGAALSTMVSGSVLLICDAQETQRDELRRAKALLDQCGCETVDLVFINAPIKGWRKRQFIQGLG